MTHVDPVTREIVRNALVSIAHEMNDVIVRTAYNPLLFETKDFAIAILSPDGDLWADDPGLVIFLSNMPTTVKSGLTKIGSANFNEGDVLIVNDPYLTGTHVSDTSVYAPVFVDGQLTAFVAITAHWADIGGRTPTGWDMTAEDIVQEGLCFTHQRLYAAGERRDDLFDLIEANVRYPMMVRGDLEAQLSACRIGARRIADLCADFGRDIVLSGMADVIELTARSVAERIAALPRVKESREITMDYDGVDWSQRPTVRVSVETGGDQIEVSLEGTSGVARTSMNLTEHGTRSAVLAAVKGLVAPTEPANAGHFRNVRIDVPPGLLVSPQRPAATDSYGLVVQVVIELTIAALAEAFPDTGRAGSYQMLSVSFMRKAGRDGDPFLMIDPVHGGHGAHSGAEGATLIFAGNGDTLNLPVEVMENRYPVRCEEYSLAHEAGGDGRHRGGAGLKRVYRMMEGDIDLTYVNENTLDVLARGETGGGTGRPNEIRVTSDDGTEVALEGRGNEYPLRKGDRVHVRTGGGGGWGADRPGA